MKLCLVKVVRILIITSYKGMVDAERLECSYNYPVRHDRVHPHWNIYGTHWFRDDKATVKTCLAACDQHVNCWSVGYWIHSLVDARFCELFIMSIHELKDTGRYDEITPEDGTGTIKPSPRVYIIYDRECVMATHNHTDTPTTKPAALTGAMCIYPVSHDREAPEWELYSIDDDFLRVDNATKETCLDYCNEDENCRSAQHIIHGDGRRYCYKYKITVQELKDSERYKQIYTETDRIWAPTYITYDRDCGECRYPVSHEWTEPNWNYLIDWMRDGSITAKICQDWCNNDRNCRSATYLIFKDSHYCYKYNITVPELKDSGRDDEIYTWLGVVQITYDRDCAAPPSTMCSNTYSVSYDWELPDWRIHAIKRIRKDDLTRQTCQDYCTKDVKCRSVHFRAYGDGSRYCFWFSISIQELKYTGRYHDIDVDDERRIITYDKQCVEISPTTKGPGTEEPKYWGINVAAIGEPMLVLFVMIGAGAVFAGGSLW